MMKCALVVTVLSALLLTVAVSGQTTTTTTTTTTTVYVSVNSGSNANNGTEAFPVQTIAAGVQILATAYSNDPTSVGVMYIENGVYDGPSQYGQRMSFPVTIIGGDQVTFDCESVGIGMTAVFDFTISNINFRNCTNGIMIQPPPDEEYNVNMDNLFFNYMSSVGIFVEGAQSLVITNTLMGNCEMAAVKVIQDVQSATFTNVNVTSLGGLWIEGATTGSISNCKFSHNAARMSDTDLYFRSQSVRIIGGTWTISDTLVEDCIGIQGNEDNFAEGGAFYFKSNVPGDTDITIDSVSFTNCSAEGYGGAAYFDGVIALIENSTFYGNTANIGGAIVVTGNGNLTILSTSFTNNSATGSGGAIDISGSSVVYMGDDDFNSNTANDGYAIGCCGVTPSCNATLHTGDENTYEDNESNNPYAMENNCQQILTLDYDNYQNTAPLDNGNDTWWIWLIVCLGIFLVVIVLVAIVAGFLGFKMYKRSKFEDIQ